MKAVCIKCWSPEALVSMDLDGTNLFRCHECDEEFTCEEVKETMKAMQQGWAKLIKWAEAYPTEEK